jgi:hypothetical protein
MSRHTIRAAIATAIVTVALFVGGKTALADTGLHQTPPITAEQATQDCGDATVADGTTLWHFVLTQTEANSGLLSVTFTNPVYVAVYPSIANPGSTLHWNVYTASGAVLQSASSSVDGDLLNLSHTCIGGPTSSPSSEPSSEPSSTPSSSPTSTPSPSSEPSTAPSADPTPTSQPSSAVPSTTPSVSTGPTLTPPPTDTAAATSAAATDDGLASAILGILFTVALMAGLNNWLFRDRSKDSRL